MNTSLDIQHNVAYGGYTVTAPIRLTEAEQLGVLVHCTSSPTTSLLRCCTAPVRCGASHLALCTTRCHPHGCTKVAHYQSCAPTITTPSPQGYRSKLQVPKQTKQHHRHPFSSLSIANLSFAIHPTIDRPPPVHPFPSSTIPPDIIPNSLWRRDPPTPKRLSSTNLHRWIPVPRAGCSLSSVPTSSFSFPHRSGVALFVSSCRTAPPELPYLA